MVGCLLFCVDVTDGAQQCSVLQVISSDIDGILHRQYYTYRYLKGRRNTQADAVSSQSKSSCFACCMLGTKFFLAHSSFTVL